MLLVRRAGFVLVGGKSSRMGCDKALLPFHGEPLARHIAAVVATAAGSATFVGDPEIYGHLGYAVVRDRKPGLGPLSGIHAALSVSDRDWNLIVACDMPEITAPFLTNLLDLAEQRDADCLVPAGPSGRPEPLCAVYHRRSLAHIEAALEAGVFKVMHAFGGAKVSVCPVMDAALFQNCNTPRNGRPTRNIKDVRRRYSDEVSGRQGAECNGGRPSVRILTHEFFGQLRGKRAGGWMAPLP